MKNWKNSAAAIALCVMMPVAAYAAVTKGDIQRLDDLILDIATADFTKAFTADSATTNNVIDLNLTSPADTTGTNTHNAANVDLTIGNATGGTNSVRGFNLGAVTGDASVNVRGINIGTGTVLGTSFGGFIDTGWDTALELNVGAAADSAQTNLGLDVDLVTPVDTTGTNSHYGINIDTTIGNATGGTNTARAINIAAVTGDASVDVVGINLAGGTALGTSNGIVIASGWDKAIDLTSAATADSGATDMGIDVNLTTPVDTTGTNTHYGLNLDFSIGNATGGTNTARGINIANVTGDAQVDIRAISVGTGTTLGTSLGLAVGSGWDTAADLSIAAAADSAQTNLGLDLNLTAPVDTTGTNTHTAANIDITIGNATGGTNTVNGLNVSNYTGDAQVNVNAINIGTSDGLGTAKAVVVGAGWDAGLEIASPVSITSTVTGDGGDALYGFKESQVASTTVSVTAAQCGTHFISNSADVMTLPEASTVLGCRYTFTCGTADDFDVNPADATDVIGSISTTNGTTGVVTLAPAAGDAIRCTDIGGSITLEAVAADLWVQVAGGNGIWTDVN